MKVSGPLLGLDAKQGKHVAVGDQESGPSQNEASVDIAVIFEEPIMHAD
jgi:hypothetical protein